MEGLARFTEHLGLEPVSLGEPITPLVAVEWGGGELLVKVEGALPTGSFKDRGSAVLAASLRQRGVERVVCDSSGNAGASLAAYLARAGMSCELYAPLSASPAKLVQAAAYGAEVVRIDGSRGDATAAALDAAATKGASYATHLREESFVAGTQTFAFELWDQLGGVAPTAIVVPVGGATLLLGIDRGFRELRRRGLVDELPALFGVQTDVCAPLVRAFESGSPSVEEAEAPVSSIAEGILLTDPPHGREAIRAVADSGGAMIAVSEEQIGAATLQLARRGLFAEPTSAVAAAGALKLRGLNVLPASGQVVVALTGSGLKAATTIQRLLTSDGR